MKIKMLDLIYDIPFSLIEYCFVCVWTSIVMELCVCVPLLCCWAPSKTHSLVNIIFQKPHIVNGRTVRVCCVCYVCVRFVFGVLNGSTQLIILPFSQGHTFTSSDSYSSAKGIRRACCFAVFRAMPRRVCDCVCAHLALNRQIQL